MDIILTKYKPNTRFTIKDILESEELVLDNFSIGEYIISIESDSSKYINSEDVFNVTVSEDNKELIFYKERCELEIDVPDTYLNKRSKDIYIDIIFIIIGLFLIGFKYEKD